jgi:NAD(P)-dependent dehydrogenase (short-subunit alcohol dehydrogenase family)
MFDPLKAFNLDKRVAIVTGGAGLLGREFCRTLASAGAHVIVADIDGMQAKQVADSILDQGLKAESLALDITEPEAINSAEAHITDRHGRLDVLVNCAARDPKFDPAHRSLHTNAFEEFPLSAWRKALDVNLTGMFLVTQMTARLMRESGSGSIINICSTYGLVGPDQRIYQRQGEEPRIKPVYYSTTKAGVLGFTRYLAAYFAGTRIRVNALSPGGVFNNHDEEFVRQYSARTILGRMAERSEMNAALLFLASDGSSYMTGANLVVDGGWTAW